MFEHGLVVSAANGLSAPPSRVALALLVPFAAGYFLSYLYRTINAVIAPDLVASLGLDAAALGLLSSAYFLSFAFFQVPLGFLLDRFGPRRVESLLLLIAATGAAIFALGEGLSSLVLGRALIGLGVSACLMGAFKAMVLWFPRSTLPLVNGIIMASGGLGAMAATLPVEMLLGVLDWRGVFGLLAVLSLAVAGLVYTMVPEAPRPESTAVPIPGLWQGLRLVFGHPLFRRVAPLTILSQTCFLSIQGLWTGPWLADVAGLSRAAVATHLFLISVAMVAGFLGMGMLAAHLGRWGISTARVAVAAMGIFMLSQLAIVLFPGTSPLLLWMTFGFFGTAGILPYAALSQRFASELAGRVNTGLNVFVFMLAFAGQWGIGGIINQWAPVAGGGYAPAGYHAAFAVALTLQIGALIWLLIPRRASEARL